MKTLALFVVFLYGGAIWGVLPFINSETMDFRHTAKRVLPQSVLLHILAIEYTDRGPQKIGIGCSGTYISPTEILTAEHCFSGYKPLKIWARGPQDSVGYQVKFIKGDVGFDLALLKAPYKHSYAMLGKSPQIGADVINVGSPMGFEFIVSQGIVAAKKFEVHNFTGRYLVTTAMIDHGSSGGGAFNKQGQLIGVNTLSVGMFGWSGISLAVDTETIRYFLKENLK